MAENINATQIPMGQLDTARAASGNLGAIPNAMPRGLVSGAARGANPSLQVIPAAQRQRAPAATRVANPAAGVMPAKAQGVPQAGQRMANPAAGIMPMQAQGNPAVGQRMMIQQGAVPLPGREVSPALGVQPVLSQGLPMVPGRTMPARSDAPQAMQPNYGNAVQVPPSGGMPVPALLAADVPLSPQAMPQIAGMPAPLVQRPQTLAQIDAARADAMGLVRRG